MSALDLPILALHLTISRKHTAIFLSIWWLIWSTLSFDTIIFQHKYFPQKSLTIAEVMYLSHRFDNLLDIHDHDYIFFEITSKIATSHQGGITRNSWSFWRSTYLLIALRIASISLKCHRPLLASWSYLMGRHHAHYLVLEVQLFLHFRLANGLPNDDESVLVQLASHPYHPHYQARFLSRPWKLSRPQRADLLMAFVFHLLHRTTLRVRVELQHPWGGNHHYVCTVWHVKNLCLAFLLNIGS